MPASPEEIKEAEEEGIEIRFLAMPVKIIGDKEVTGMKCIKMKLGERDETGRYRPVPIKGSEFDLELDTVIPAIGQSPEIAWLSECGIGISDTGIVIDKKCATNRKGVYAGGDAVSPRTVVDAIASGKKAAMAIHASLLG
jgi:NADPH-dependent glutamate synthase beta subunit-like oxidoreductase